MRRRGFTMVEVVLALGLFSILVLALVRLLDTSLTIWDRTAVGRDVTGMGETVLDLMAEDLVALEPGPRGDLLGDWWRFDVDRDGTTGLLWPRVRFVRQATAADLLRATPPPEESAGGVDTRPVDPRTKGLVEVCWALLPGRQTDPAERPLGMLWRGVRRVGDDSLSFLDERFFGAGGRPATASLDLVTGGVLWLELAYASQTSVTHDGWTIGDELRDAALAWDAWNRDRPDLEVSYLNNAAAGMPAALELPALPRRVRLTIEIERPAELRRRATLTAAVDGEGTELQVSDERRLPPAGRMILVDEEWMRVLSSGRGYALVARAQRGTRAAPHQAGARIHHGLPLTREVPIATTREDWSFR